MGKKLNVLSMLCIPVFLFLLMEHLFSTELVGLRLGTGLYLLNILFWELCFFLLFFIFGNARWAGIIQSVFMLLLGLADHYLMRFRGTPLMPWDFSSAYTAFSVAGNYSFGLSFYAIMIIVGFVLAIIWSAFLTLSITKDIKHFVALRTGLSILTAGLICALTLIIQSDKLTVQTGFLNWLFFQTDMTREDGIALSFMYDLQYLKVKKPDGYSPERARQLVEEASSKYAGLVVRSDADKPNIIVVMSEAFSDPSVLRGFETNKEIMPFMNEMQKGMDNVLSGYLRVPVIGGHTANSEFEFLTGNEMKWLSERSVPYQQYIDHNMESIASVLSDDGYETVAIHPYKKKGWNRDRVYEYLGFDRFITDDEFVDPMLVRDYISDRSDYDKVLEVLEGSDKPVFIFNVTMQNHGGYLEKYDNFEPSVKAVDIEDIEFNQYISLLRITDEETRKLYERLKESEEPVVLVFFGDHQPADIVVQELYSDVGKDVYLLEEHERERRYLVPFFVWANYDIPESTGIMSTPYELGNKVMSLADADLGEYQKFTICAQNGLFKDEDIRIVQYYRLFDENEN